MENSVQIDNNSEQFVQWYVDTLENFPNIFVHYLSQDALLQWFGRSVRGPERILYFIKSNMQGTKHNIIGVQRREIKYDVVIEPIETTETSTNINITNTQTQLTPESKVSSVIFDLDEIDEFAGGDGPNIDKMPLIPLTETTSKPQNQPLTFFETTGAMEFCRPCYKRTVAEMAWKRPCTLKVGYVGGLENLVDLNIQLIIYGDNMPCKRNLLPEFDKCLSESEETQD